MAIYLNPDNKAFKMLRSSDYFVDRSLIINDITTITRAKNKYLCVARPPRFGKTSDVYMLVAYYSKGCDSSSLFDDLKIASTKDYRKHLNQYNVILMNMKDFYSSTWNVEDMISLLSRVLIEEIEQQYGVSQIVKDDLRAFLEAYSYKTNQRFIFIIDEWDCPLRDVRTTIEDINDYLSFLTALLKNQYYVQFVYMTGILPFNKLDSMFDEITVANSHPFEHFIGFTEAQVKRLCIKNNVDYDKMKQWYGGYLLDQQVRIYCPYIIIKSLYYRRYYGYWNQSENYMILKKYLSQDYIDMEGIQGDVIKLLIGEKVHVSPYSFKNNLIHISSNNDVLTALVYLGYLTLDCYNEASIPCLDIFQVFKNVVCHLHWPETEKAFKKRASLYVSTWAGDGQKVGQLIEEIHHDLMKLSYWDDNCILYSLELAYLDSPYYQPRIVLLSKSGRKVLFYPSKSNKPSLLFDLIWQEQDRVIDYLSNLGLYPDNLLLITLIYKETGHYYYHLQSCQIIQL